MITVLRKFTQPARGRKRLSSEAWIMLHPNHIVMIEQGHEPERESLVYLRGRPPFVLAHSMGELDTMIRQWRSHKATGGNT